MGCLHRSAGYVQRNRIHLSLPPLDFLADLQETRIGVEVDHDLEAVVLRFADFEVLLSVQSAIGVVVRLLEAIDILRGEHG